MKILTYDVETAPKLGNVWGIWQQNIPLNMLLEDGYMLSWAAKWLDSDEIFSDRLDNYGNKLENEGLLATSLHELLDEADALITFNGEAFDNKVAATAFLTAGLDKPAPSKNIDLFRVCKREFKFTSNKLSFILNKLGLEDKVETGGFELWRGCMDGKKSSWNKMMKYNIQDVHATEALYYYLRDGGWIKNHPSLTIKDDDETIRCNNCGSTHLHKKGIEYLKKTSYQRYKCADCGTHMRGNDLLNTHAKRKSILHNI